VKSVTGGPNTHGTVSLTDVTVTYTLIRASVSGLVHVHGV
jgi:hypothetical protein